MGREGLRIMEIGNGNGEEVKGEEEGKGKREND